MTGVEFVTHAWKSWGIQALVLLSFTLQVALLILAECRRCIDSGVLRFFAWSAYMTADATAIFVLGHLSVSSTSVGQELMAFWAPFLLMHLGGQDNITAYSIEDNRLWLRHLQTLAVQAVATGYIIYQSFVVGSPPLLRWASAVMFIVGMVKYGERVWALRCAGGGLIKGKNYRILHGDAKSIYVSDPCVERVLSGGPIDTEAYLIVAQRMLDAPIDLLMERPRFNVGSDPPIDLLPEGRLYKVVELQISLMYDVFYTKAQLMHSSLYGIGIRMLSAVATAVALVLFHLHVVLGDRRHHRPIISYRRVDTVVTYVLVVGAVLLETMSLLREMFSSWTSHRIIRWTAVRDPEGRKRSLMRYVLWKLIWLRRLVHVADWRRRCSWSRSMGQHNLLQVCTRSITSRRSKIARRMEAEDWWNTLAYSWSVPVSPLIEKLLIHTVSAYKYGEVFDSWGEAELKRLGGLYEQEEGLDWSLENRIIAWHIATGIWCYEKQQAKTPMVEAVEVLSNYMMFLLASRTYLLPPFTSRNAYVEICFFLKDTIARQKGYNSAEDLVNLLRRMGDKLQTQEARTTFYLDAFVGIDGSSVPRRMELLLQASCALGAWLVREDSQGQNNTIVELLAKVWMEAVCDTAKRCSAYSHAKQLCNGSDLITVAAFLLQHMSEFTFPW